MLTPLSLQTVCKKCALWYFRERKDLKDFLWRNIHTYMYTSVCALYNQALTLISLDLPTYKACGIPIPASLLELSISHTCCHKQKWGDQRGITQWNITETISGQTHRACLFSQILGWTVFWIMTEGKKGKSKKKKDNMVALSACRVFFIGVLKFEISPRQTVTGACAEFKEKTT